MLNIGVFSSLILWASISLFTFPLLLLFLFVVPRGSDTVHTDASIFPAPFQLTAPHIQFTMMLCYFAFCLSDENHIVLRCDTHFYYTL